MPRTIKRTESELIQHIGGIAADTRRLLDDSHYESTFQLRTRDSAIGRELTVGVVRADSCTDLDQLIQVAQPRCGVALVVLGEAAGTTATLNLDNDGSARLEPLGLSVKPVRLSAATGEAIDQLVAPPPAPDDDSADDQPEYTDDVTAEIEDGQLSHANHQVEENESDEGDDWELPCPEVLVRVLGTPAIDQYPKLGRSELNIVTFLACAGGQATEDQVIDAVWSGQLRERKTLWNKLSIARAALGRHLPPRDQSTGIVSLHPAVMTDLQLLTTLVDRANRVSSYEATGLLSDALELVRGVPFDAVGYDWAHEHQHHARACELIETAGLRLVDLALEADDVVTARTAVSRALAALKINEPLYRARMKIEAHAGNTAGVRSVYDELVCLMNDLDPADGGAPSAQTTQLLRSLNTSAAATR